MLDNMPNFQLGMFDALSDVGYSFRNAFPTDSKMKDISELLSYDGRIWMFSPENKINPVSSANKMYREARKNLKAFNVALADGTETFGQRPADLAFILKKAGQNIAKSVSDLEKHINENKGRYTDLHSDEIFYYTQGKFYGYYLLLNAVGQDYRNLITSSELYAKWTLMTKTLADASGLHPLVVRNGSMDSLFSPNHLNAIAFYGLKTDMVIQEVIRRLEISTGNIVNDY